MTKAAVMKLAPIERSIVQAVERRGSLRMMDIPKNVRYMAFDSSARGLDSILRRLDALGFVVFDGEYVYKVDSR